MGQKLTGEFKSNPLINYKSKIGGYFIGALVAGPRAVRMKRGTQDVYDLKIEDTDFAIEEKKGDKYVEAEVKVGDLVSVFAPTVLTKAFQRAKAGDRIRFEYKGQKGDTNYHDFDVELV